MRKIKHVERASVSKETDRALASALQTAARFPTLHPLTRRRGLADRTIVRPRVPRPGRTGGAKASQQDLCHIGKSNRLPRVEAIRRADARCGFNRLTEVSPCTGHWCPSTARTMR